LPLLLTQLQKNLETKILDSKAYVCVVVVVVVTVWFSVVHNYSSSAIV
jgi:hypothetical protein